MHNHFLELRQRLAECRAALRTSKDRFEFVKAEATQRAQPNGKNAEERAVALTLALENDGDYLNARSAYRRAESEVERVDALLEAARDERRASEWQIRAKFADGLFRAGVPNEQADDEADDEAFDDVADVELDYYAEEAARDNAIENDLVSTNGHNALDDEDFPF